VSDFDDDGPSYAGYNKCGFFGKEEAKEICWDAALDNHLCDLDYDQPRFLMWPCLPDEENFDDWEGITIIGKD
jgi:hypothetical protein